MKALLELQEGERQLHKQQRAQQRAVSGPAPTISPGPASSQAPPPGSPQARPPARPRPQDLPGPGLQPGPAPRISPARPPTFPHHYDLLCPAHSQAGPLLPPIIWGSTFPAPVTVLAPPKSSVPEPSPVERAAPSQRWPHLSAFPSQHGGLGLSSPSQWGADSSALWSSHEKWDEGVKNLRSLGLKSSRSSPSLGDSYGGPSRQSRKKTDEEEKLLKLLQGIHKPQDGFTQWCEQMLHVLNSSSTLDVPTVVAFLKEMESPYDVHDFIRSYLGDTMEAKEFAKQFLERRAKQKASQQRQQQQEASWLSSGNLPSPFPANHGTKQPPFEGSQPVKIKRRPIMLHADPSILGYSLHGPAGEVESIDDY